MPHWVNGLKVLNALRHLIWNHKKDHESLPSLHTVLKRLTASDMESRPKLQYHWLGIAVLNALRHLIWNHCFYAYRHKLPVCAQRLTASDMESRFSTVDYFEHEVCSTPYGI